MNILMLTNTYLPHMGGVARSVQAFAEEFRRQGHRVLVVAPEFEGMPDDEIDVVRVPAIQNFNGSDFSVRLPIPGFLEAALRDFRPDVVHSHHSFLLGDTAIRIAALFDVPLVFTHHTMYEQYTHYVPGDSSALRRFVIELTLGYTDLCDRVIAPSESVAAVLRQRGVISPLEVIPTGVDAPAFAQGDGAGFRRLRGIPANAYVVGHLGRLAPEKNLPFLAAAVALYLRENRRAHFLVVGAGPSEEDIRRLFPGQLAERLHMAGKRQGQELIDAYHAMDVFAFASQSETQGMVLTEAMAAGLPVVAVDACGVREVVEDGVNGRLLPSENRRSFAAALDWVARRTPDERTALRAAALETAERFSMPRTAAKTLALYESLVVQEAREKQTAHSAWERALRLIEVEWELWSNLAHAARATFPKGRLLSVPVIGRLLLGWRSVRRWFSRGEWSAKLLRLPRFRTGRTAPGLVLIQIDGLSRTQMENALRRRKLPFLRRLMVREHYRLHTLYSGQPATTPAVQGELFYGVRTAVPAFSYFDRQERKVVRMLETEAAAKVQKRLSALGDPLLREGAAYSNIYTGGAAEPHFCAAALGWGDLLKYAHPLGILAFLVWNAWSLVRTVALLLLETVLALIDCARGLIAGRDLMKELKFLPSRIGVTILLRELMTVAAQVDAVRGVPAIHLNYLAYDEHAHHRGPGSSYAHWSLKGIDDAIQRVWKAARRSDRRDYSIWVYSDHGQEATVPYSEEYGKTIEQAVAEAFLKLDMRHAVSAPVHGRGEQAQRVRYLGPRLPQRLLPRAERQPQPIDPDEIVVAALGPIGHIYLPRRLNATDTAAVAELLVREQHVPLVMAVAGADAGDRAAADGSAGVVRAWTANGSFLLPDEADKVLPPDHPFLQDVAVDLAAVCRHPDAGDLVVGGWRNEGQPLSFVLEYGAHAGPGPEETRGFALLPAYAPPPETEHGYLRPLDLRQAALAALGRGPRPRPHRRPVPHRRVRIVTYNVHSCVGMDGRLSPSRIARVIAQCDPDIVALQELDVRRWRTNGDDQAHAIARELQMEFHFHPALSLEEEQYGDAVLSRYPMRLVRAAALPGQPHRDDREPRGALWVAVDVDGCEVQLVNTHLGLSPAERLAQVEALLGPEWAGSAEFRGPAVLCGDFNAMPRSPAYRRVCQVFRDAQLCLNGHRPKRTWFSHYPLSRIDHVFVGRHVEVLSVDVPRSQLAGVASDHLPLVVDLNLE